MSDVGDSRKGQSQMLIESMRWTISLVSYNITEHFLNAMQRGSDGGIRWGGIVTIFYFSTINYRIRYDKKKNMVDWRSSTVGWEFSVSSIFIFFRLFLATLFSCPSTNSSCRIYCQQRDRFDDWFIRLSVTEVHQHSFDSSFSPLLWFILPFKNIKSSITTPELGTGRTEPNDNWPLCAWNEGWSQEASSTYPSMHYLRIYDDISIEISRSLL